MVICFWKNKFNDHCCKMQQCWRSFYDLNIVDYHGLRSLFCSQWGSGCGENSLHIQSIDISNHHSCAYKRIQSKLKHECVALCCNAKLLVAACSWQHLWVQVPARVQVRGSPSWCCVRCPPIRIPRCITKSGWNGGQNQWRGLGQPRRNVWRMSPLFAAPLNCWSREIRKARTRWVVEVQLFNLHVQSHSCVRNEPTFMFNYSYLRNVPYKQKCQCNIVYDQKSVCVSKMCVCVWVQLLSLQLAKICHRLHEIGAPTVIMKLVTLLMFNLGTIQQSLDAVEYFAGEQAVPKLV